MERGEFQAALQVLRDEYARTLPGKVSDLVEKWQALCQGPWDPAEFAVLIRMAHTLAGSGATYGYMRVSQTARALEVYLKESDLVQVPLPTECHEVQVYLARLQAAIHENPGPDIAGGVGKPDTGNGSHGAVPTPGSDEALVCSAVELSSGSSSIEQSLDEPLPSRVGRTSPADAPRLVLLYEPDPVLANQIELGLTHYAFQVQRLSAMAELWARVIEQLPAAILVDWDAARAAQDEAELLGLVRLHEREPALPILFLSEQDDVLARLNAVRHGATGVIVKPLEIVPLLEALDLQTGSRSADPFRILIVDDDVALAAYSASVLELAGMVCLVVTNPLQVLENLIDFHPDLILTDVYMPDVNGLELAEILRQQEAYVGIPIVFLSGESNVDKQLSAMLLGGDDFLRKPIEPHHLVTSVTSRVRRARNLRTLAERDGLTGLLNHTRLKEQLAVEIARATREGSSLAYAMLDIDHFKTVNDTYGHTTGDRVLKSLSRLLRQRLRKTDVLGRYGGEEFAAILPSTDAGTAFALIEELREAFLWVHHTAGGAEFNVSISGGIATLPPCSTAAELTEAADRALYQAKRNGRNQVMVSFEE